MQESISTEHQHIHNGEMFSYSDLNSVSASGVINHSFKTGGKQSHFRMSVASDQAITVALVEGATLVAPAGTAVTTVYNRKRNSPLAPQAVLLDTVSFSGGTTIFSERRGTAAAPATPILFESLPRDNQEWILAPNTMYVFQVTNNGAATANISTQVNWYEIQE